MALRQVQSFLSYFQKRKKWGKLSKNFVTLTRMEDTIVMVKVLFHLIKEIVNILFLYHVTATSPLLLPFILLSYCTRVLSV